MNISIGQWVVLLLAALCAPVAAAGLDTDSLDQTFGEGGDGRQVLDVDGEATAVAIDAEDRIVLLGSGVNQHFFARFDANGVPDPEFAMLQIPDFDGAPKLGLNSIAFRSDGTIVVAGYWLGLQGQPCSDGCWAICQITQAGLLDTNFGDDETPGCARLTDEPGIAVAITIQPDGKLLLAGVGVENVPLSDVSMPTAASIRRSAPVAYSCFTSNTARAIFAVCILAAMA